MKLSMRILVAALVVASASAFAPSSRVGAPVASTSVTQMNAFFGGSKDVVEESPVFEEPGIQEKFFDPATEVFLTALRIGTCALMIHHGFDKVQNVDGFSKNVVAKFFGFLPGPASFWTLSAAGTQIAGSGLLALGILARPVALSMCATMVVAVIFHLLNTGAEGFPLAVVPQHSYNYELAAMYVAVLSYFSVKGAGAYSIDEIVFGGELNLYGKLLGGVFGGDDEE
eukprot:CAMPEP_0197185648 /NCGR_PEP_ID=MMETSP1423-20130617/12378_1 /TAXON_ID=476441 /ORGANISM="Pseudo-nitzschia heimii, Strain UNC1101" /LENGTH=226 /DNA_ID=CAMNT_0042636773 /DNA_START=100 /DNA_END=780 /DNA_ORIENTATION=+